MDRRKFLASSAAIAVGSAASGALSTLALAQSRGTSLRALGAGSPNTLDPQSPTSVDRPAQGILENTTDRLARFGTKIVSNGVACYDYDNVDPELAESWQWSSDGTSMTFKIRRDATFHDGSPATAHDVKWSLDRAIDHASTRGQLRVGSMRDKKQFVVVDDHTFRIDLPRRDPRLVRDLCHPFCSISNSKLALQHATKDDPDGTDWMKSNSTGGGAFRVESLTPGQQYVLVRNDNWKCGPKPFFERVIYQVVPEPVSRRALVERGSADITLDLPPKEVSDLEQKKGKVQILSIPVVNGFEFVGMTTTVKPFDNVKVRQAIAFGLPYKNMFDAGLYKRGTPLYGGPSTKPTNIDWPAPFPYDTNLERAKSLLAEAGHANGLDITFVYATDQADVGDPIAILMQEALKKIGVNMKIEKMQAGQMGSALEKHQIGFYYQRSSAWLNDPVYAFEIFYEGDHRWNLGNLQSEKLNKIAAAARFETDKEKYRNLVVQLKEIAFDEIPVMMLWQPANDVVAQNDIKGFKYMPHRQLDFRPLHRA